MMKLQALCLIILMGSAFAIPAGFMTFFDTIACPNGWFQPPETQGRLILSVTSNQDAGVTVNKPLAEQEIREHKHSFDIPYNLPSRSITAPVIECCNFKGACAGAHSGVGVLNDTQGNVPFSQLLLCQIKEANDAPVPVGVVGYFAVETKTCPTGWSAYGTSKGRFLMSGYATMGIVESQEPAIRPGQDIAHTHAVNAPVTTGSQSFLSDSWCCNDKLGQQGTYMVSGNSELASSNIPYISLLTCVQQESTFDSGLPSGALLFNSVSCTPGWNISIQACGRFLVSNPLDGTPGVAFGGKSLEPGFSKGPSHSHRYQGTTELKSCGVDVLSGITALHYAHSDTLSFSGVSSEGDIGIPFVSMPLCVQFR